MLTCDKLEGVVKLQVNNTCNGQHDMAKKIRKKVSLETWDKVPDGSIHSFLGHTRIPHNTL